MHIWYASPKPCLNIKTFLPGIGISIIKIRWSHDHLIIPPAPTKLKGGYTGFTLSICPSVDRIVSALYLQQYSSNPFHICTSYQATSEGVSLVTCQNLQFWQVCSFDGLFVTCQNLQFWQVCSSDGLSVCLFVCLFVLRYRSHRSTDPH